MRYEIKHNSNHFHDCNEQRPESNGTKMVEDSLKKGTESSKEGHIVFERLVDVFQLTEIPSAESARNRHLIETLNKGE